MFSAAALSPSGKTVSVYPSRVVSVTFFTPRFRQHLDRVRRPVRDQAYVRGQRSLGRFAAFLSGGGGRVWMRLQGTKGRFAPFFIPPRFDPFIVDSFHLYRKVAVEFRASIRMVACFYRTSGAQLGAGLLGPSVVAVGPVRGSVHGRFAPFLSRGGGGCRASCRSLGARVPSHGRRIMAICSRRVNGRPRDAATIS